MNLEKALTELIKKPKSMIASDGKSYPALRYTYDTHLAIKWLVERYNDGTLQVIGYDYKANAAEKRKKRQKIHRNQILEVDGVMRKCDFIKRSGLGRRIVDRIATESNSVFKVGYYYYVNTDKFYEYLSKHDMVVKHFKYVNLAEAARFLNLEPKEVKQLIQEGKIYKKPYNNREYKISVESLEEYLSKKGEEDGENNTDDGEVH